jgi:hypothetical protein
LTQPRQREGGGERDREGLVLGTPMGVNLLTHHPAAAVSLRATRSDSETEIQLMEPSATSLEQVHVQET